MISNKECQVLPGGEKYGCIFRLYGCDKQVQEIYTKNDEHQSVKIWSIKEGIIDSELYQKYSESMYYLLKSGNIIEDGYVIDMIRKELFD